MLVTSAFSIRIEITQPVSLVIDFRTWHALHEIVFRMLVKISVPVHCNNILEKPLFQTLAVAYSLDSEVCS